MGSVLSYLTGRHPAGPSLVNVWSHFVLRMMHTDKSAAAFRRRIAAERAAAPARPMSWLLRLLFNVEVTSGRYDSGAVERPYTVFRPRGGPTGGAAAGAVFLYLHGGAYTSEAIVHHFNLVSLLAHRLGCSVYVPAYPLAPEHTCGEVQRWVDAFYRDVIAPAAGADRRILVGGDSAGGGLSLALAQRMAAAPPSSAAATAITSTTASPPTPTSTSAATTTGAAGGPLLRRPDSLLLLSPWLDATVSAADARQLERDDPMLGVDWLIAAGQMYMGAAARDAGDPAAGGACPLWGPLSGLPPVNLWIGTHDILLSECRALRDRWIRESAEGEGGGWAGEEGAQRICSGGAGGGGGQTLVVTSPRTGTLRYFEHAGVTHVWMAILGMPEAASAVDEIVAAAEEDCQRCVHSS